MLTALDILREKRLAKKKKIEGQFVDKLMDEVLASLSMDRATGYVYVNCDHREEFALFIETLQEIIKDNFTVGRLITEYNADDEDLEIEVYFDLDKKPKLKTSDVG